MCDSRVGNTRARDRTDMVASRGSKDKGERDICQDADYSKSGAGSLDLESAHLGKEEQRSKMQELNEDLTEVEQTMTQAIRKAVKRGEDLYALQNRTEEMTEAAQHFKQTSQKVACSYCWKNVKLVVVIIVVVVIIILIIVLLATGVIPVSAPVPPITPTNKP